MSTEISMFSSRGAKPSRVPAHVEEILGDGFDLKEFVENFDILAEASGGTANLKSLVTGLALLGRIGANSGAETPIPRPEASHLPLLPTNWVWVALQSLITFGPKNGYSPKAVEFETPVKSLTLTATSSGRFDGRFFKYIDEQIPPDSEFWLRDGDLLVQRGNTIEYVGVAAVYRGPPRAFIYPDLMMKVRLSEDVDLDFVHMALNGPVAREFIVSRASGTSGTMPKINQATLLAIPIPLPPLAEQKRIVTRVDELMHLLDDLEAKQTRKRETQARLRTAALHALTSAEEPEEFEAAWNRVSENFGVLLDGALAVRLLRATILELAVRGRLCRRKAGGQSGRDILAEAARDRRRLLTEGSIREPKAGNRGPEQLSFELPEDWEWGLIGETFDVVGGLQKTPARAPVRHHYPYLRVENVQRGRLDLDRMERFEVSDDELRRLRLQRGDLLVVEGNGSETEIGRCARWEGTIENCIHQNHIIRCRSLGPMSGEFTLLFLNSPSGIAEMKRLAITTSGLYSLSVGKVRGIAVPIPGEKERDETLAKVEHLMKLCDDLEAKLRRAEDGAAKLVEAVVAEMTA